MKNNNNLFNPELEESKARIQRVENADNVQNYRDVLKQEKTTQAIRQKNVFI